MAKVAFTKDSGVKMIDLTNKEQVEAVKAAGWALVVEKTTKAKKGE